MIGYIYRITNTITGQNYIGQTIDINRRRKTHLYTLRINHHDNPKLQASWNKYGEANFDFESWEFEINSIEELNKLECEYIDKYDGLTEGFNLVPGGGKPPLHQKVNNDDIATFLCVQYLLGDGYGKTCEQIFGWARGTASAAKRKKRYAEGWLIYESLTDEKKIERANDFIKSQHLKEQALTRKLNQGGCAKAYQLTQDDYNFAFCAEELGYDYQPVAQYLGIKPSTVKDWFRRGVHASEKEKYYSLPENQKNIIKEKVRNTHLEAIGHDKITEEKERQIIQYLCYCDFYKPVKKQIERAYNWASGTIRGIETEGRYPMTKAKFNLLSEEEKRKEAEELCQRLAV